jgi:DNA-binding NarL/FixJ family response regulator
MATIAPAADTAGMGKANGKSVYIVEDSPHVRGCLVDLIESVQGVSIVGEAETPSVAVAGIIETRPDYVVLDFQLRGGTGLDVLDEARGKLPGTVFIILTNHATPQYRRLCLSAGASCFFDKTTEFARVRDVISGATVASAAN